MKRLIFAALPIAVAVLLAGCGKSAEFKKMEADLLASVASMHDDGMSLMSKAKELTASLDEAIGQYDSMAAKYPKQFAGQSSDDLKAAKEKLAATVDSMKAWMASMKPYDPTMDHAEAMAQLEQAKNGIVRVKAQFNEAITSATAALEAHRAAAAEMAAKLTKTVKKAGKN